MKFFKNKLAVTVVVLSVAFLGLIVFSIKRDNRSFIEDGVTGALNPVQKVFYNISDTIKNFGEFAVNFSDVKKENEELKKKNNELESMAIEYRSLKNENERLRDLVNFKEQKSEYDYLTCNIIGKAGNSFLDGYIIDRGKDDGLEKGMVVVAAKGLVGQVTSVASNWAIVQSLTNENIAVAALVESTRETVGIVTGYRDSNGRLLAKVYNLPLTSEVKEGDVILTSGSGNIYPKDIKIGEVIGVTEDKVKLMKVAIVEPYVDYNKLEELMIIVPKDKRDIKY